MKKAATIKKINAITGEPLPYCECGKDVIMPIEVGGFIYGYLSRCEACVSAALTYDKNPAEALRRRDEKNHKEETE